MMPKFVLLPTDIVVVVLLAALTFYLIHVARSEELKARWRYVVSSGASLCSLFLPSALRRRFCALPSRH